MSKKYFVTGIGTEIGKTVTSAILVEALQADYWKPIQSGDLDNSDTKKIQQWISNSNSKFHPEAYRLTQPFSPHQAAELDRVEISLSEIELPQTNNNLIVEGAGGLLVPLNQKDLMIDLIKKLDLEVILVSQNYLGSINHTLLSAEALKLRSIRVKGIIFTGKENTASEAIIQHISGLNIIAHIPFIEKIDKNSIRENAKNINFK